MGPPSYMRSVVNRNVVMRRIPVLSFVSSQALQHFPTLSHKRHELRGGGVIEKKLFVLIFSTTFVFNSSYSKKNAATYYHKCAQVFV